MPKITGLGAAAAPANTDVLVLVSNTAGTANTQKVTVNTFFSNVTANAKFAKQNKQSVANEAVSVSVIINIKYLIFYRVKYPREGSNL